VTLHNVATHPSGSQSRFFANRLPAG
jgi:hypothetical protein